MNEPDSRKASIDQVHVITAVGRLLQKVRGRRLLGEHAPHDLEGEVPEQADEPLLRQVRRDAMLPNAFALGPVQLSLPGLHQGGQVSGEHLALLTRRDPRVRAEHQVEPCGPATTSANDHHQVLPLVTSRLGHRPFVLPGSCELGPLPIIVMIHTSR